MGKDVKRKIAQARLRKEQKERMIEPIHLGGEWYAKVDPDTGAIQWIRKKIKRKK